MRFLTVFVSTASLLLAGCAGLTADTLTAAEDNKVSSDGFRYYETAPFLLIYTDGKGGLVSKILYLPDSTKLRTIKPYNYAASNNTTLKFDKGRLLQAKAVVDETVIPSAVIAGLEKVAAASIKAANGDPAGIPSPYLFRIYGDTKGNWSLNGDQALNKDAPEIIRFVK